MFYECTNLTEITIPQNVTNLFSYAFEFCTSLAKIYFKGNAPDVGSIIFGGDAKAVAYYLSGTTGWGPTLSGIPTVLWNPQMQTSGPNFGVQGNKFGFNLIGSSNLVIVVEACTNFINPVWQPIQTNTLTNGTSYFSDPHWTNYSGRFYRLQSP
jgi:hypothetical protein